MTQVKIKELYEMAKKYQSKGIGKRWGELYDFIMEIGKERLFNGENIDKLAGKMDIYLGSFKMKMFGRTGLNRERLKAVIIDVKKHLKAFSCDGSQDSYVRAWKALYESLSSHKIKNSNVMITKILMGLGGWVPSLDTNVVRSLTNIPGLIQIGINGLLFRQHDNVG